jgi:coronin-1B/1C/6
LTYDEIKSVATGLEWSHNGSLLGCVTKDKQLNIFDPRKEGPSMVSNAHEGAKTQKICWLGDSSTVLTTGFSRTSER